MNWPQPTRLIRAAAGAVVLSTLLIGGCDNTGTGRNVGASTGDDNDPSMRLSRFMTRAPIVEPGIELHRIIVWRTGDRELDRLLQPHLEESAARNLLHNALAAAGQAPVQRIEAMRRDGLSVCLVPIEDLDRIVDGLSIDPSIESTWLGSVPRWRAIANGPRLNFTSRVVQVGGTNDTFFDGQFRYMLRAFPVQTLEDPILRLELIPQFHQPERNPFKPDPEKENLMGRWIESSALAVALKGEHALLVTVVLDSQTTPFPEASEPVMKAEASPDDGAQDGGGEGDETQDRDETNVSTTPTFDQVGPVGDAVRTVGAELLESDDRNQYLLLVFIPRLPWLEAGPEPDQP